MSRGLGTAQRAILEALAATEYLALTVADLAAALDRSPGQVRTAVAALAGRGLVAVTHEHLGWAGEGEYGRLTIKQPGNSRHDELPTVLAIKAEEDWPFREGWVASNDTTFTRNGMPTHGLLVWLPANRHAALLADWETTLSINRHFRRSPLAANYDDIAEQCAALGYRPPKRPARLRAD